MKLGVFISCFTLVGIVVSGADNRREPMPVSEIDMVKYMGKWFTVYEPPKYIYVAADKDVINDQAICKTSIYGRKSDDQFLAYVSWTLHGKLKAFFGNVTRKGQAGTFVGYRNVTNNPEPIWILKLGPVRDNLYDYSIYATPEKNSTFVNTRDIKRFNETYQAEVEKWMNDHLSDSRREPHPSDCFYAKKPEELFNPSSASSTTAMILLTTSVPEELFNPSSASSSTAMILLTTSLLLLSL